MYVTSSPPTNPNSVSLPNPSRFPPFTSTTDLLMALNGSIDRRELPQAAMNGNGNGVLTSNQSSLYSNLRLKLNPNMDHKPENYEDLELDFNPSLYSSLERYLPQSMLAVSRDDKLNYLRDILSKYLPDGERNRVQKHKEYRQKILTRYEPKHKELYSLQPDAFFVSSFISAITESSVRRIMNEAAPGIYTFQMLQPSFCEMLLSEVENFEKWVQEAKIRIMRPNTMNKYGAVLDDFGMEAMLSKFMEQFICPISKELFPEVGGGSLDSHHGFVVEYGNDRDVDLGFHVDDSEVTLNVCLGKQFSGGELFFRGIRCDKHVNSDVQPEECLDYTHIPGQAVIHRGRHRHGARATTSGHRINLLLWCRSSNFRELKKHQTDFSNWCGECEREKTERQRQTLATTKMELLKNGVPTV